MYRTPSKSRPSLPKSAAKRAKTSRRVKQRTAYNPAVVSFGRQPFPKQLKNTLKYAEVRLANVTAGVLTQLFSCNGCYDPYQSGGGRQPLYFDQLCAVYDHYTVLRSRIKITWTATAVVPLLCTLYIEDDATTVANAADAIDRPGVYSILAKPDYGAVNIVLYSSWSAVDVFGPGTQADPSMQGTAAANPTEIQNWCFQVYDATSAVTTTNGTLLTEIEYDCVWDEFVTVANS